MLQQDVPSDYVIATGEAHTVRDVLDIAFSSLGLNYREHVAIDPRLFRPAEVHSLLGNPARAQRELHWESRVTFRELIVEVAKADLDNLKRHH